MKTFLKINIIIYFLFPFFVFALNSTQVVGSTFVCSPTTNPCVAPTTSTTTEETSSTTPTVRLTSSDSGGIPSQVGINQLRIIDFNLETNSTFANFNIELNNPSKSFVYLGEAPNLEKGLVYSGILSKTQSFNLVDLTPNKQYYYKIEFIDAVGSRINIGVKTFFTLEISDNIFEQKNVSDINIKILDIGLELSWKGIDISEDSYFRVIKSYKFYPIDPYDGIPVYEGKGDNFLDTNVIDNTNYFYTIFTCNYNGFCSSGVGAFSFFNKEGKIDKTISTSTISFGEKKQLIKNITIFENERKITPQFGVYYITGKGPIRLMVDTEIDKIDEIKEIFIDVDINNKIAGSHIAKYNKAKKNFETSGFYLSDNGDYELKIKVFDFNKKIVSEKTLKFNSSQQILPTSENECVLGVVNFIYCYWELIFLAFVIILLLKFFIF